MLAILYQVNTLEIIIRLNSRHFFYEWGPKNYKLLSKISNSTNQNLLDGSENADGRAVEWTAADVFKAAGHNKQPTASFWAWLLVFWIFCV